MENLKIALAIESSQKNEMRFLLDELTRDNAALRRELDSKQTQIELLKEEVALLRKTIFAPSSEKRQSIEKEPTTQLLMVFNEAEIIALTAPAEDKPEDKPGTEEPKPEHKKRGRKPISDTLPREEQKTDPGPDCPNCKHEMDILGEEVTERIEIIPARVIVKKTVSIKRVCKNSDCEQFEKIVVVPAEPQIIPQGLPTAGALAAVVTAKFVDGMPLHRQEAQLGRLGLDVSRNTLANWVIKAALACYTLGELLLEEVRAGPVINMDETKMQVLDEPGRDPTDRSFMWVARGGLPDKPAVFFRYSPTRSGKVATDILGSFQGYLQTDGYSGYELVGKRPGIRHLGCLAHVRRKFIDVEKINKGNSKRGIAREALDLIKAIYEVERKADRAKMTPDQRKMLRQEEAKPLLDKLKALLDKYKDAAPAKSLLGKAITYGLNQWEYIPVYLEDGLLRPDNNSAENAIRPFVVGRKNWLFAYSQQGAEASALLYSLVETAKANGLEPYAYLRFLFTELPKAKLEADIKALLPQYVDRKRLTEIS